MQAVIDQMVALFGLYAPRVIGALVIVVIAWIVASIVRFVITRAGRAAKLDLWVNRGVKPAAGSASLTATLANVGYWFVWLLALPPLLDALSLPGLLAPIQNMLNQFLGFLPNLIAAVVIGAIGWFVANIVRQVVSNLLAAIGLDQLSARVGLAATMGGQQLSGILGTIAAVFVGIPVAIAALNALKLDAVTQPASAMLNTILQAIPNLFVAAIILGLSFVIGRIIAGIVTSILASIGFNSLPTRLGLSSSGTFGGRTLAEIGGTVVLWSLMSVALVQALQVLGLAALTTIVLQLVALAGRVLLAVVILAIGLFVANFAASMVRGSGLAQATLLATVTRIAIVALIGTIALQQIGLAPEIITLAFSLTLGAAAVATAIAFGIGGRESAAKITEGWRRSFQSESASESLTADRNPAILKPLAHLWDVERQLKGSESLTPHQQELLNQITTATIDLASAIGVRRN